MAPVSSLSSPPCGSSSISPLSSMNAATRIIRKCFEPRVLCCKGNGNSGELWNSCRIQEQSGTYGGRREVMFQMIFAAIFSRAAVSCALAENDLLEGFRIYSDDQNKFKILIPRDWQVGAGEPKGFRSVTAFYPEEASSSNVSVVITEVGADYTRLESFGKVDAFAENLVNGLDRSWKRPPGVAAKLIDCKASKGFYYIEYSLQNPGESCRHIYSAIGMATVGWYNRLYTVTGQFLEEDSAKYSSAIEKAVASFRFI